MPKLLSNGQVAAFRERGYHFPVDALSESEVAGFRSKLEDYEAESGGPIRGEMRLQRITMAQAVLNDGQRLLAFNDLFVGVRSHVSARYHISHGSRSEEHSSCGILVSTGAGSTGWLRSVYAGAAAVAQAMGASFAGARVHNTNLAAPSADGRFAWDAAQLVFAVREPWPSKTTGASVVYGTVTPDAPLVVASRMAEGGVIFSDGIEADFLSFTAGLTATIGISDKTAHLIMPG